MGRFWKALCQIWVSSPPVPSPATCLGFASDEDRVPTPPALVTESQTTNNIHKLLDSDITFFVPYPSPKPEATDKPVEGITVQKADRPRTALKTENIHRTNQPPSERSKAHSRDSAAAASLQAVLAKSTRYQQTMAPERARPNQGGYRSFAPMESPKPAQEQYDYDSSPEHTCLESSKPSQFLGFFGNPWFNTPVHTMQYQLGLKKSLVSRAVADLVQLHDQYAGYLMRTGRPVNQMGGRQGAFTAETVATVLHRWGRQQHADLHLSLGIHEGYVVFVDGHDGPKTNDADSVTVWIYCESYTQTHDHESYNRLSVFKGLRSVESQLATTALVRRLTYQSSEAVVMGWSE
ncbi:hypothetical protein QBC34DRAFT_423918 [Podospora aff. communis PSN243]|uniref:Uncharacterized protein n=1 Tax=Podospora aff. communis PSN243 TaxID=3040156 RepID=A0AAV9GVS5_9PEZI|nr:hypothetical protein QBC34DRAFT_423918 [Podospora aff. communis PSN243]